MVVSSGCMGSVISYTQKDDGLKELGSEEIPNGKFVDYLICDDWFNQTHDNYIYVRYYSMPFVPGKEFEIIGMDGSEVVIDDVKFRVLVTRIVDQNYECVIPNMVCDEEGNNKIVLDKIKRNMHGNYYIVISTPMNEESYGEYDKASDNMDKFSGMLRSIYGNNLLYAFVREGSVNVSTKKIRTLTESVKSLNPQHGPHATYHKTRIFSKISESLTTHYKQEGSRIMLAFQLVEKAANTRGVFKLFAYWVAIEVAANNDSTGKIVTLLAKAYKKKNGYIKNDLGLTKIIAARNAVFHNGTEYSLPSDVERYIQCVFLDVIGAKLGLEIGYMEGMIGEGFPIGRLNYEKFQSNMLTVKGPQSGE
jgi:hypothetical protein